MNQTQWEYCIVAPSPGGPQLITVTTYTAAGAETIQHRDESYTKATTLLWPSVIANLGLEGWELVTVEMGAWHFKRRIDDDYV